jgi:hypothetical protein
VRGTARRFLTLRRIIKSSGSRTDRSDCNSNVHPFREQTYAVTPRRERLPPMQVAKIEHMYLATGTNWPLTTCWTAPMKRAQAPSVCGNLTPQVLRSQLRNSSLNQSQESSVAGPLLRTLEHTPRASSRMLAGLNPQFMMPETSSARATPSRCTQRCAGCSCARGSAAGCAYFDESAYAELTRWMCVRFDAMGHTAITRVYHCPYHPVHGIGEYRRDHPWRKPHPGMILQAISDFGPILRERAVAAPGVIIRLTGILYRYFIVNCA